MSQEYTVEPLTAELFGEMVPLMEDVFGGHPQVELFDWKYLRNPAGPAIGNVARSPEGELAAFYGMIPELYSWAGKQVKIYQSCDTMTHSRHRRKGLFQLLAQETYAAAMAADPGFFAIGFSGPMSTPGFLKMGWTNPFDIGHRFVPKPLAAVLSFARTGPPAVERMPDALPSLMAKNAAGRTNCKCFYPEFVAWRMSTPAISYAYVIDDGAYAIFKRDAEFLYLLDFWEESHGAGKAVMASVLRESCAKGSRGVLTACQSGGTYERILRRHGFLRNPFKRGPASDSTPFITYGKPPGETAASKTGWDITPVDFDSL